MIKWIENKLHLITFRRSRTGGCFQSVETAEWQASIFSLQYDLWNKHEIRENRGDDHWLKQLLVVQQILLVSLFGNVWRTVWRISILMLGCKGLNHSHPNISMNILHTIPHTFPKVLKRKNCLTIKSFFSWWPLLLFSWPLCVIQGWYCKKN